MLHWRGQGTVLVTSLFHSFALRATSPLVTLETVDSENDRIHLAQGFMMTVYTGSRNVQVNNIFLSCVGGGSKESSFSIYEDSTLVKSILRCTICYFTFIV